MSQITPSLLCAVRGGKESRATVTKAIDLSLEMDVRLVFLHISDAEFLGRSTFGRPLSVVYKELLEMSEFAMLMLCDRAQRRGVKTVEYVLREGDIRKQLQQAAIETRAKIMVMGRPIRSPGSNVFKAEDYDGFIDKLEEIGELQIVQVMPDDPQS